MLKLKIWMYMLTEFGWFITPSHVWAIGHSLLSHLHAMKVCLTHWITHILHINIKHEKHKNLTAQLKYRKILSFLQTLRTPLRSLWQKSGKSPWIKRIRSKFTTDLDLASLKKFHCWLNSTLFIKKFYYWIVCSFLKKEQFSLVPSIHRHMALNWNELNWAQLLGNIIKAELFHFLSKICQKLRELNNNFMWNTVDFADLDHKLIVFIM